MRSKLLIIKTTYIIGIVADALWTLAFLFPQVFKIMTNDPAFVINFQSRLILGIAASLMAGWTVLLIWAYQRPIERRGVLLITAIPVVLGLSLVSLARVLYSDNLSLWIFVKTVILFFLLMYSFISARQISKEKDD